MKETINIRYRSIIDHGNLQKVSDQIQVEAVHEATMILESYTFVHPTYGKMVVQIKDGKVYLSYGYTSMEMIFEKKHRILYQTPYGQIELEVYLKKLNHTSDSLHLVYYLYDHQAILSKCYLMIDKINPMLS